MSTNWLGDTPIVIPSLCPDCNPDADPRTYDSRHCETHAPLREGVEDAAVPVDGFLNGSSEAGGYDNRAFCEWLHRKKRLLS